MRVAMIQMQVGEDKVGNLYHAMDLISKAKAGGADLAVLPEMFCCPYETPRFPIYAEPEGGPHFQMMAKGGRRQRHLSGRRVDARIGRGRTHLQHRLRLWAGRQPAGQTPQDASV